LRFTASSSDYVGQRDDEKKYHIIKKYLKIGLCLITNNKIVKNIVNIITLKIIHHHIKMDNKYRIYFGKKIYLIKIYGFNKQI